MFCCYLPPETSVWCNSTEFFGHLMAQVYMYNDVDCILLAGDFNSRICDIQDHVVEVDNVSYRQIIDKGRMNKNGESFIEFLRDMKLSIVNGRVTPEHDNYTCTKFNGSSVVDYIVVPQICIDNCETCKVLMVSDLINEYDLESLLSQRCKPPDHSIILVDFVVSFFPESKYFECTGVENHTVFKQKKYNLKTFPDNFQNNEKWCKCLLDIIDQVQNCKSNQQDIDKAYDMFVGCVTNEMDEYLLCSSKSVKKRFKYFKPYWDKELKECWDNLHEADKKFRKCKTNCQTKKKMFFDYKEKQKNFDKMLRKKERTFTKTKIIEIEKLETNNPREFWKHIKSLGPVKKQSIPECVRISDEEVTSDENIVINRWEKDFKLLYDRPTEVMGNFDENFYNNIVNLKDMLEHNMINEEGNIMLNRAVSYDEIECIVDRLKAGKAPGIDNIPNEVLKYDLTKKFLFYFISKCFMTGIVPSLWLKAIICPIPKGGNKDPYLPMSYRGLSLLSTVSKIYTSFLHNWLTKYLDELDLIVDEQCGFRKGRSCLDQAYVLMSIIKNRMNVNKDTYVAFVDMEKCFDWVDREMLFYKLLMYNIDGYFYKAVKSLYSDTLSCLRLNDKFTDWFDTKSGVRQGEVLSPTLFNIMINDLVKEINELNMGVDCGADKVSILLYADDIALISDDAEKLQNILNYMKSWCTKWRMKVNVKKTNVVHFRKKRKHLCKQKFLYGNEIIYTVPNYRYLGFYFDEHLDFIFGTNLLIDSGNRALGSVISKFKTLKDAGFNTFTKMVDNCVNPICEYFSGIWGYVHNKNINKVHNRACRYHLGLPPKTPIYGFQGDIGWLLPKYRNYCNMVRLYNRLVKKKNECLVKKIFLWDKEQPGKSWYKEFTCLLEEIDHPVPASDKCIDIDIFIEKCRSHQNSEWSKLIISKPKLRTFMKFKTQFGCEPYVYLNLSKSQRSLMSQFRMGVLPLYIETGRYDRTPVEKRICQFCSLNRVEDEFHFLSECTAYNCLRTDLYEKICSIDNYFKDLSVENGFVHIMKHHQILIVKYIFDAWAKRKQILYE